VLIDKLTHAYVQTLPEFSNTFDLKCDAYGVGIGFVLLHARYPFVYLVKNFMFPPLSILPMTKIFIF